MSQLMCALSSHVLKNKLALLHFIRFPRGWSVYAENIIHTHSASVLHNTIFTYFRRIRDGFNSITMGVRLRIRMDTKCYIRFEPSCTPATLTRFWARLPQTLQ
jgi:hypothetical protein